MLVVSEKNAYFYLCFMCEPFLDNLEATCEPFLKELC